MEIKEILKHIRHDIVYKRLSPALHLLEEITADNVAWGLCDKIKTVKDTYAFMLDALEKKQNDPKLNENFFHLLRNTYALYAQVKWHVRKEQNQDILTVNGQQFVATTEEITRELKKGHDQEYINNVFLMLTNQPLWTDDEASEMEKLLLSEDIDSKDRQMIVTAIMMSATGTFDYRKTLCLANVYMKSDDLHVRTRALVGWVMSLDAEMAVIFPEEQILIDKLVTNSETVQNDLFRLQIQMIYCLSAAQDHQIINKDILPGLMTKDGNSKNPKFDIRIIEDPDSVEDFQEREESEKQIEELEEKAEQMMDMQRKGSDIYFGGFVTMKDFDFFKQLPNWFCPFYYEHPALKDIYKGDVPENAIRGLLAAVPFCDSDKYSFAMAMNMVISKIPPKMLELLGEGEIKNLSNATGIPKEAIVLRNYLQDLFRFYRLSKYRHKFADIFTDGRNLFIAAPIFLPTGIQERFYTQTARLLMEKERYGDVEKLIHAYKNSTEDEDFMALAAKFYLKVGMYPHSETYYRFLLQKNGSSRAYLNGLARCYFLQEDYQNSLEQYNKLTDLYLDEYKLQLNRAICQTYIKEELDDAMKTFARLYYEHPNDINVVRAYAWGHLISKQLPQAENKYAEVLKMQPAGNAMLSAEDHKNYALTLWFEGKKHEAIEEFATALQNAPHRISAEESLLKEKFILSHFNITEVEFSLLTDLIDRRINQNPK